ncbi:hypothetical protein [Mucilaginibacter jinjuensis]|uniref:Uncharacterized protein n=1 Tax=Mucilaginibacter jinjuensis TaxID=1176721 RepID=A0ABY7T4Q5_9SPHI|nr:hypothetical protein [Mucilaginibacter jinjuensis]WCT11357.1 hypothetical protein PQO05_21700 [Mucilaginibacter jinjuensis]
MTEKLITNRKELASIMLDKWEENLQPIRQLGIKHPEVLIAYTLSQYFLIQLLGISWCETNMMLRELPNIGKLKLNFFGEPWSNDREKAVPNSFMRTFSKTVEDQAIHQYRIIELGEMLYNSLLIPNNDENIDMIRAGQIESTFFALQAARLLLTSDTNFKFIKTSGIKGNDYDAEITLDDGTEVCCEMKCKIEATLLSDDTILRVLKKARAQIAKGKLGAVFVSLPQTWLTNPELAPILSRTITEFFRGTKAIISIVFYISEIQIFDSKIARIYIAHEFVNTNVEYVKQYFQSHSGNNILIKGDLIPTKDYRQFLKVNFEAMSPDGIFLVPVDESDS